MLCQNVTPAGPFTFYTCSYQPTSCYGARQTSGHALTLLLLASPAASSVVTSHMTCKIVLWLFRDMTALLIAVEALLFAAHLNPGSWLKAQLLYAHGLKVL